MHSRISIIVLLFISFVIGFTSAQCPTPSIVCNNQNGICGSKLCYVYNPTSWDYITVSPPLELTRTNPNFIISMVNVTGNYTFTFIQGSCVENVTKQVIVPTYTVTQPKCYQGVYTVTSHASFFDSTYQFSLNNQPFTTNTTATDYYTQDHNTLTIRSEGPSCSVGIKVKAQNPIVPTWKFVHPTCAQANGKFIVTNYQQFSNLTLKMNAQSTNITAVNGVFSGVQVANGNIDYFTLYATSPLCDSEMVIRGLYPAYTPVISVKSTPISTSSCNNTHSYLTFNVDGLPTLGSPNVTVNGANYTIGVAYIMPIDEYNIAYSGDTCSVSIDYDSYAYVVPVTYSLSPVRPTCTTNSTVTLFSPTNEYSSLEILSNYNGVVQNVTMNANHQFQYGYDESITVTGKCGSLSLGNIQTPVPNVFTYIDNNDCAANMTISVLDYQRYKILEITGNYLGQTYQPVKGQFLNIWYDRYTLTYSEDGCQNYTQNYGSRPVSYIDTNFVYFDVKITVPRIFCNETYTSLNVTPIYKGLVGMQIALNVTSSALSSPIPFIHPRCPSAQPATFQLSKYKDITPPTFTLAQAPKCASSWPLIKINTSSPYSRVLSSYGILPKSADDIYPVDPNNPSIEIDYDCTTIPYNLNFLSDLFTPTQPNTDVEYEVIPQDNNDCATANGAIKINTALYTNALINHDLPTNGTWSNLGYGSYLMTYSHNVCGVGSINIPVPTSTSGLTFSSTIVKKATCLGYEQGDAILYFNITHSNGQAVNITNVIGPQSNVVTLLSSSSTYYNPVSGLVYNIQGGLNDFYITVGDYCTFKQSVQVPVLVTSNHAFKATILQYPINNLQSGLVRVDPLFEGLTVYHIIADNGEVTGDNSSYISGMEYSTYLDLNQIEIQYNYYCYDYLYINTTYPEQYYPQFTVEAVKQCGTTLATIQFEQETLDRYYIFIAYYGQVQSTDPITLSNLNKIEYSYQDKISLELQYDIYYFNSYNLQDYDVNPVVTITNETCTGTTDGSITVSGVDFTNNIVSILSGNGQALPSTILGNTMIFYNVSSGDYNMYVKSPVNPYCLVSRFIQVFTVTPTFRLSTDDICVDSNGDVTSIGSFKVGVGSPLFQLSLSVNGVKQTGTTFTSGDQGYYNMLINATYAQCSYSYVIMTYLRANTNSPMMVTSQNCEEIIAAANGDSIQIYNSMGDIVAENSEDENQDVSSFKVPGGLYRVDSKDRCYTPTYIQVQSCSSKGNNNVNSSSILSTPSFLLLIIISLISYLFI